jgi:pimeloyl-ACP methyl ester carboxylesterase
MARDVQTVVAGLDRGPVAFFGHSLGGAAGMLAEALTPGTVSAIYVYEPAVLAGVDGIDTASAEMARLTRARRAVVASREDAVARLGSRPPYDTMLPEALLAYVTHGTVAYGTRNGDGSTYRLKCDPENEARVYEAPSKITVDQVAGIPVPVLIGMGEREPGLPAAAAPLIAAALGARLESYPDLGHMGPFENPVLIADRVARHMSADRPDASRPEAIRSDLDPPGVRRTGAGRSG